MNPIQTTFNKGKTFISYLTAGDGGIDYSVQSLLALVKGGVDLLEIGIPFSDPIADGPVIQAAMQRALNAGITPFDVLDIVARVRKQTDTPIVLFGYYNPILTLLKQHFFSRAYQAGVNGMLIVDVPLEESSLYHDQCKQSQIEPVYVITPATPLERIKKIDAITNTFLYYACRKGTTGVKQGLPEDLQEKLTETKHHIKSPIAVGFGIGSKESANIALEHADGFVVGSKFVSAVENKATPAELTTLAQSIDPRGKTL